MIPSLLVRGLDTQDPALIEQGADELKQGTTFMSLATDEINNLQH